MARQITGLSVKIHRHRSHTGQCFLEKRISSIPLSNQPTSGTWRELRTSTNFISEQGRQEAPGGQKAVPNASASSIQQHLCRWQGLGSHGAADAAHQPPSKGLQDTASPFSAAPPAPPAEREPAASGGTGEATHSPKGAMNAILRPLPAHWHTSAHICPHLLTRLPALGIQPGGGKGHRSLTSRIRRCLGRSANPCAFASLCRACRWSGGQHPLRYGRDIRHSWCLTLSPSGTFSP